MKKYILLLITLLPSFAMASSQQLYEQVIINDAKMAKSSAYKLLRSVEKSSIEEIKSQFRHLILAWKKVEAAYILGEMDDYYIDTPRYLDIFHGGNEDIKVQINRIVNSNDDLSYALYKHSHKTVNALEYLLYTHDLTKPRVKSIAKIMISSIADYLGEILENYQQLQSKFTKNQKRASAWILNVLVDSTYKLKEWRIGDVAGLSYKYRGKPDNRRAEYYLSGNSVAAILAILNTQKRLIDSPNYQDFGDVARAHKANSEIEIAIRALNDSINSAKQLQDKELASEKANQLYQSTNRLLRAYYLSLMEKLGFMGKILEADGD
jgi:predicted lipoprotein